MARSAYQRLVSKEKQLLKEALLHQLNLNGQFLIQYKGFTVTFQELSVLCYEHYFTDEVINLLIIKRLSA